MCLQLNHVRGIVTDGSVLRNATVPIPTIVTGSQVPPRSVDAREGSSMTLFANQVSIYLEWNAHLTVQIRFVYFTLIVREILST